MIIWINGAFGAGKTTLAEELQRRLPEAMPFDPEYVGYILIKWVPPSASGDFQDIPLWRKLVAEFAIGMSADYGRPLIVPMPGGCWRPRRDAPPSRNAPAGGRIRRGIAALPRRVPG